MPVWSASLKHILLAVAYDRLVDASDLSPLTTADPLLRLLPPSHMLSPSRKSLACSIVQSTCSPWDLGNAAPPTPLGSGPVMENVNLAVDKR